MQNKTFYTKKPGLAPGFFVVAVGFANAVSVSLDVKSLGSHFFGFLHSSNCYFLDQPTSDAERRTPRACMTLRAVPNSGLPVSLRAR
jgi:hypothetical protein